MKELELLDKQVDEVAVQVLKNAKAESANVGEVKNVLDLHLKKANWDQDKLAIEVIKRASKMFEKEVDAIRC